MPSFVSPSSARPRAAAGRPGTAPDATTQVYVGDYQARATAMADSDPATPMGDEVSMVAGTYDLRWSRAPGYGHARVGAVARGRTDGGTCGCG